MLSGVKSNPFGKSFIWDRISFLLRCRCRKRSEIFFDLSQRLFKIVSKVFELVTNEVFKMQRGSKIKKKLVVALQS